MAAADCRDQAWRFLRGSKSSRCAVQGESVFGSTRRTASDGTLRYIAWDLFFACSNPADNPFPSIVLNSRLLS